jgi:peroxiredoxin
MPNVVAAYQKYHELGFEVIGVSLDKDEDALKRFVKENKMIWPQFFDGQGWRNALATKYGIQSIPATFLIDGDGKIVAKDLRGRALEAELARRLEKK